MTITHVVGIDPSLTNTGVAVLHADLSASAARFGSRGKRTDTLADTNSRINSLCAEVACWTSTQSFAVIEGPSFASIGGLPWDRAGLWWRIVAGLLAHEIPVAVVAPSCRAKWATGSGSASKAAVAAAMQRRFPAVEIGSDDEADALALACMGGQHLGWGKPPTALQQKALAAVRWPEVTG